MYILEFVAIYFQFFPLWSSQTIESEINIAFFPFSFTVTQIQVGPSMMGEGLRNTHTTMAACVHHLADI